MPNYNTQLQSNNTDLQAALQTLQNKSVGGGYQSTPVISVNNSNGLIAATAGTKTSTHQLAFQPAKTITPSTTSQIAVSNGYYTGGDIIVEAIPSTYVKPSYTKVASTYTPTTTNQTISAGTYLTGAQTIKGDVNLVAGNIKSGVSIFGVNGSLQDGGSSGSDNVEDSFIERTITAYTDNKTTSIGSHAFYAYYSLTSVSFPAAKTIGRCAFYACKSLASVSFPAATTIGNGAFAYCSSLTSVSFPAATTIVSYAFSNCTNLTSVSFPAVTTIGSYAFQYCTSLTSVSFPAATTIGSYAFSSCSSLTSIYLTASKVCTLSKSNAFSKTGIWSNKGSIYVPSSLVASYKAATNWAFFSDRIFSAP